jgi:hypothetical protein
MRGSYAAGAAWLQALLEVAEAGSPVSDELLAEAYNAAGGLAEARGRFNEAEAFANKALPLKRKIGDVASVAALATLPGIKLGARE